MLRPVTRRTLGPLLTLLIVLTIALPARAADILPGGIERHRDLIYAKVKIRQNEPGELKLDLYRPQRFEGKLPVIVWVHGGAWWAGSKRACPAALMVPRGYAAISISYRLSQHAPFPAQIHDCKSAIRWVRANAEKYNLDPNRIGVWGASAGGHLVSLLGTGGGVKKLEGNGAHNDQSSRVQCVVNWFGPTDLIKLNGPDGADIGGRNPIEQLLGGPVDEKQDLAVLANPITHVTKDDPPFLIMHGTKDKLVPLDQSKLLETALKKAKVDVELYVVEGAGHGFWGQKIVERLAAFFDQHLKEKSKE